MFSLGKGFRWATTGDSDPAVAIGSCNKGRYCMLVLRPLDISFKTVFPMQRLHIARNSCGVGSGGCAWNGIHKLNQCSNIGEHYDVGEWCAASVMIVDRLHVSRGSRSHALQQMHLCNGHVLACVHYAWMLNGHDDAVQDWILPLIGAIFQGTRFTELYFTINYSQFNYGHFINESLVFVLVCLILYLGVVVPLNKVRI